jgi:predicted Zn-ribbon and HTH transcriptional regulator
MRKEVVNMDYRELRKLKMELLQKNNKSDSEIQLLAELQSLSGIIDRMQHSISLSTKICKSCGRPL